MVSSLLVGGDDPAEKFQLPQIRETLQGLFDLAHAFLGFRPASPEEIDRIAKPASTLMARRPQVQNVVKKFSAPGVLAGAFFAYLLPRLNERRNVPPKSPPRPNVDVVAERPAASTQPASPSMTASDQQPPPVSPAAAAAVAAHAQNVIDAARRGMPG